MQSFTTEIYLAVGILFGLFWSRRTGWSCGGLITPGILAAHSDMPLNCLFSVLAGIILAPVLSFISRRWRLYGRERVGASILLALAARCLWICLPEWSGVPAWLGWVVPGLIAADIERQGLCVTLAGTFSVSVAASFASSLAAAFFSLL